MNKVILVGALGKDPESRTVSSGSTVCSFSLAVTERRGRDEETTTWFKVSAWNKLGENCQRYLAKGKKALVVGTVSLSTYEGRDGKTRASLDVFASEVEFLSPKSESKYDNGAFSDADESGAKGNTAFEPDDEPLPWEV